MFDSLNASWTSVLSFAAFALLAAGIVLLLKLDAGRVSSDLTDTLEKRKDKSLRSEIRKAKANGEMQSGPSGWAERFQDFLDEASAALTVTLPRKKEKKRTDSDETPKGGKGILAFLCALALFLGAGFAVAGLFIGNVFLVPVLAAFGFSLPFFWLRHALNAYRSRVTEELETGLSVLSASYVRSGDLLAAVKENLPYLRSPVKEPFAQFLFEASHVDADLEKAVSRLKDAFPHPVFKEWCDALAACDKDRAMSDLLLPCAAKLTDERLVNAELVTVTENAKKEYYVLLGLVFGSVPLLWLLNGDWLDALLHTLPGQLVTALSALTAFITYLLLGKAVRPVGYGKNKRDGSKRNRPKGGEPA
ncbi:MAG: hypothetical protein J5843_04630 [Clostridia bacterium]|nr:hypothetical protein [Clostridia bacterium]